MAHGFHLGTDQLAIILIFGIPLVAVGGSMLIGLAKVLRGNPGKGLTQEEALLIQEIHLGLQRMEQRIEVLETILLDKGTSPEMSNRWTGPRMEKEEAAF